MNKNEIYDLEIIDNGPSFEGIARKDGMVVFVPGGIAGENIKTKIIKSNKNYSVGRIENINKKSVYRCDPFCEVYKTCGGCGSQHIEYDFQLLMKRNMVKTLLEKQKMDYKKLNNTVGMGMPYYYRNKVQYPVREDLNGDTKIGFYSKGSHRLVENNCCYIQNRVIDILSKNVFDELLKLNFSGYSEEKNTGDIRHILIRRGYHTQEVMVIIIVNKKGLLKDTRFKTFVKSLLSTNDNINGIFLNLNESKTNEILGNETIKLYGEDYINDYIGEYKYKISPKSFFQVNTLQAEVLYGELKNKLNLQGNEILFDLYSGVGSIGIFLSDTVSKVYGIEIEESAVDMANINLKYNDVNNAEYIAGSVEDKIIEFKNRNIHPDVIVVDPPRKGLDEKSIEYVLEFNPKKIGYVSCNPATLARDLKLLSVKYDIEEVTPVDMFPYTDHVECVVSLSLKDN